MFQTLINIITCKKNTPNEEIGYDNEVSLQKVCSKPPTRNIPKINPEFQEEFETLDGETWFKSSVQPRWTPLPKKATINGRHVAIFQNKNGIIPHVIDNSCYHAGGNLSKTENIEDIEGQSCISCPLHGYMFSLETGDRFIRNVSFKKDDKTGKLKPVVGDWESDGVKQRVHKAKLDSEGYLWICLNLKGDVPSDKFCPNNKFT